MDEKIDEMDEMDLDAQPSQQTTSLLQNEFARRSCDVRVPAIGRVPAGADLPNYTVERAQCVDGSTFLLYRDAHGTPIGSRMTALAATGQLELPKSEYERMSAALFERQEHEEDLLRTFVLGSQLAANRVCPRKAKPYPSFLSKTLYTNRLSTQSAASLEHLAFVEEVGHRLIVLDLYCGLGGLSLGLQASGFHHCAGVDCWKTAVGAYIHNGCGAWGLLRKIRSDSLDAWAEAIEAAFPTLPTHPTLPTPASPLLCTDPGCRSLMLVGGPPCQPFSKRGIRMGCADEREGLSNFLTLVCRVKPIAFLVENVPEMVENRLFSEWLDAQLRRVRDEYKTHIELHLCEQHRVPQHRKRVSISGYYRRAWANGVPPVQIPTHEDDVYLPWDAWSQESEAFWSGPTPVDLCMEPISLRSRQRITTAKQSAGLVVANRPAGTVVTTCMSGNSWHRMALVPCPVTSSEGLDDLCSDDDFWPQSPDAKAVDLTDSINSTDSTAPQIAYNSLRALQPRHIQLLQSFPPEFVLYGSLRAQGQLLGNAVPPMLAYDLGCAMIRSLQSATLPPFDAAATLARLRIELERRTL